MEPQECNPTSQNVSTVVFRGKKWKIHSHNISFVFFGISFVYFIEQVVSRGNTSRCARKIIFMFLKTGEPGEWDKLWS